MTVFYLNGSPTKGQTITGQGQTVPMNNFTPLGSPNPPTQTVQVVATASSGTIAATVQPLGSNDGVSWTNLGTAITIVAGASPQVAGQVYNTTYQYFAANITALTGTGPNCTVTLAV
jgi:hypothetical protein